MENKIYQLSHILFLSGCCGIQINAAGGLDARFITKNVQKLVTENNNKSPRRRKKETSTTKVLPLKKYIYTKSKRKSTKNYVLKKNTSSGV